MQTTSTLHLDLISGALKWVHKLISILKKAYMENHGRKPFVQVYIMQKVRNILFHTFGELSLAIIPSYSFCIFTRRFDRR